MVLFMGELDVGIKRSSIILIAGRVDLVPFGLVLLPEEGGINVWAK